ncbi:MAG: response regulator [Planctomycetaceae bacterium]|jgi:signal transduction histidine kinase/CheY-like chemotaxis protein|nr:response regulator [Planctomycetaceae bacterium]
MLLLLFSWTFLVVIIAITFVAMVILTYLYGAEKKLRQWLCIAWLIFLVLHIIGVMCVRTSVQQSQNRTMQLLNSLCDHLLFDFPIEYASIPYTISTEEPLYQEGLSFLFELHQDVKGICAVYTLQENENGDIVFCLSPQVDLNRDNKIEGELEEAEPPGLLFPPGLSLVQSKIKQILREGDSGITEPYHDRWGRWITMLRPLRNSEGKIVSVFAVDFWGEDWEQTFFFARVWPMLFYESFLIYFFFQLLLLLKHRTQEKNLHSYSYELEKLLKDTERVQRQLDSVDQNKRDFMENVYEMSFIHIQHLTTGIEQLQLSRTPNKLSISPDIPTPETILGNIHDTCAEMIAFLDNIHIYSTLDWQHIPSHFDSVPLKDFLQSIGDSLNRYLKRKSHLSLHVYIDDAIPDLVLIHFQYFMKILMELLNNAIRFTPSGKIELRVSVKYPGQSLVSISTLDEIPENAFSSSMIPGYLFYDAYEEEPISDQLPYLKITVSDTGCGIEKKFQESLFKPFHKQDGNHVAKKSILTFGLCTVKRLAQMIGGRIWVNSSPGQGSSFSFLLPFALPMSPQADQENISHKTYNIHSRPLNGLRILVVNESVANQVFIATILIEAGATTESVNNGMKAIERVQAEQQRGRFFDLILMDSYMLQMNGYQVIYELRNRGFMRPVILLGSTFDKPPQLHPVACSTMIRKPIDRQHLIQTITALTKRKRNTFFRREKTTPQQN